MEDNLKKYLKNGRQHPKKIKIEDDLNFFLNQNKKNGRRPQKKMEDDLKKI